MSVRRLLVTSTYTANLAAFVTINSIRTAIDGVAVRAQRGRACWMVGGAAMVGHHALPAPPGGHTAGPNANLCAQDLRGRAVGTSPVYLERLRKVRCRKGG